MLAKKILNLPFVKLPVYDAEIKGLVNMGSSLQTVMLLLEPRHEKTCLRGFRPGKTQTSLLSHRDQLES